MIETVPSGTILRGKYRIERVLGSGGFGHVYLATELTTNQQCAVKEYLVTGSSGQEQLKHEAAVLSQLHHPNLPAYLDAFMEDGRYYITLNYIEGRDLTDHLRLTRQRNEVIPLQQVMQWLLSICDAVMFLHSQHPSVIHRDIKPDNIRITSNGTAILVDMGNAKAAADGARTLFFIRHQGTPGYAPPEQYPGGSGTDTRSDVYALGGTLYFALTAHEPASVSIRNQSIQLHQPDLPTLQERLSKNPPETPPEANELRQFRLGVSKPTKPAPRHSRHLAQLGTLTPELLDRLNRTILRAMAIRPKDRYQFVSDFANDLRAILAVLPKRQPPATQAPHIDPHSTQPDLHGVYDALQAAKEQQPAATSNPTPQADSCPRCNSPLAAASQAQFCPRCGIQLRPSEHNAGKGLQDIADEQTMIVKLPKDGQAMLMQPSTPPQAPPYQSRSATPQAQPGQRLHGIVQYGPQLAQASPKATATATQAPPQARPVIRPVNMNQVPHTHQAGVASSSSFNPKWSIMIIVIIILVLLVIIMVFLLVQITHMHATLQAVPARLVGSAQWLANHLSTPHFRD